MIQLIKGNDFKKGDVMMKKLLNTLIGLVLVGSFGMIFQNNPVIAHESYQMQSETIWVQRYLYFKDFPYPPNGYWVEQGGYRGYIYYRGIGETYYIYSGYLRKGDHYAPNHLISEGIE